MALRASNLALKERAIALRAQGLSQEKVAKQLDISVMTLRILIRDSDRERKERFIAEVKRLGGRPNFLPAREVATRLYISTPLAKYWMDKLNVLELAA